MNILSTDGPASPYFVIPLVVYLPTARSSYAILHPHNGCSFSTLDMRKCCLLSPYPITRVSCNLQSQRTATYYIHTLAHVIHIHVSKHYSTYYIQFSDPKHHATSMFKTVAFILTATLLPGSSMLVQKFVETSAEGSADVPAGDSSVSTSAPEPYTRC